MKKQSIQTSGAPAAIGPYAQGVRIGDMIYASGQLPIDMATGELETQDIAKATANCLSNLQAIWEAAGGRRSGVVKVSVFLTDLANFNAMNEAYAAFFGEDKPARACVQVAALPKGAPIEIEAVVAVET